MIKMEEEVETTMDMAAKLYRYIVSFDREIYANEERREDSLIQQATNMQTAFSFITAAVFMIAPIVIEYRGKLCLEFFLLAFSAISIFLLGCLFCATKAQKRSKRLSFPDAEAFQKEVETKYDEFQTEAQRQKYIANTFSELHKSLSSTNEIRVKWILWSMRLFYISLGLCVFFFAIAMVKLFII